MRGIGARESVGGAGGVSLVVIPTWSDWDIMTARTSDFTEASVSAEASVPE